MQSRRSPGIRSVRWGRVVLEDGRAFKDAKLFPGGAREWDWNETGTRHSPGIQLADVQELIDHGATVVVLSQGQLGRLKIGSDTLRFLDDLGVAHHVLGTREAVGLYERLRMREPTGALIHSTC